MRYAITDRSVLPGDDAAKNRALLLMAARWAADGVDYVQLREKNMEAGALAELARAMMAALGPETKLLINARLDVAIAVGAEGVHLTARDGELRPQQVRQAYVLAAVTEPIVSVACHSIGAVEQAKENGAGVVLFSPVFGKQANGRVVVEGSGLVELRRACVAAAPLRVFALGGVTAANAKECIDAGAAGVAGIRMFA